MKWPRLAGDSVVVVLGPRIDPSRVPAVMSWATFVEAVGVALGGFVWSSCAVQVEGRYTGADVVRMIDALPMDRRMQLYGDLVHQHDIHGLRSPDYWARVAGVPEHLVAVVELAQ